MTDDRLDRVILDSIWERVQWDFLVQNPQLSDWLEGSTLRATADPDVFWLVVANNDAVEWLSAHTFAIRRSLSAELKRPVEVEVVGRPVEVKIVRILDGHPGVKK